jgi:hypothetical protein
MFILQADAEVYTGFMADSSLSDTHPDIEALQVRLLREAGLVKRAGMAAHLTDDVIAMSRRAIQRLHPEWSDLEVRLFWAEVHYGKELADRVRAYLRERGEL